MKLQPTTNCFFTNEKERELVKQVFHSFQVKVSTEHEDFSRLASEFCNKGVDEVTQNVWTVNNYNIVSLDEFVFCPF